MMELEEKEKLDRRLGKICWENETFVLRAKMNGGGYLRVIVNRKYNGKEYLAGSHTPGVTSLVVGD